MKRTLILVYTGFLVILIANFLYYRSLYNKQIGYITALLNRQVQIVGLSVDNTNNLFASDLNELNFPGDLEFFFKDPARHYRAEEKMKLFFSKYQDFVTGIKLYDNNKNEFTLKKDETGDWLDQEFVLHIQGEIVSEEKMVEENKKFDYYLPIISNNKAIEDIVVTVDYQKYFNEIFSVFNLKEYQWQWVLSDSGEIVFSNSENKIKYSQIKKLTTALENGTVENFIHKADINGKPREILSSFYPTQLLRRNLGLVFSAPTDFFQKYIIRNSIFIVTGTLLLIQLIIFLFWRYFKKQESEIGHLSESEKMLFKLIEEMPVGVIIHNKNREIIKANKVAAKQYSYSDEADMTGKIFPETSLPDVSDYFSRNLGGAFNPDQFIIIKKEIGEMVLFRNSIPVVFMGEAATMEILIDVTMLESARKQEAKANVAKSEFLARMSYEIRTPLNGIIGMTDILSKHNHSPEVVEVIHLLRRSTEVLLNIIDDILDFSKIETGKLILDEIPFSLREEIKYCYDLARAYIAEKEVVFSYNVDDNIPESIIADQFRLRQVLTNLIDHSALNTEKGQIILSCKLLDNKSGIITLMFELLDTGAEFDKASLKKIFGDFVNIESKAVRSSDESGFGTVLARQLVELMGGELNVECPSGLPGNKGTKVTFTITAYSNDRLIKDIDQSEITSFEKIKTLFITGQLNRDDETLNSLHKLSLNVAVTTFQKSTVGQIKTSLRSAAERYNLIVIADDVEFNGFDAAKSIWDNNLSGSLVIIIVSSNDQKGNYMKCITMGVDHYLVKPLDRNELVTAIRDSFPYIENKPGDLDLNNIRSDLNILIVEDNKLNQKVLGAMLKSLGYSYDLAEDGFEGLQQAKNKKYDLIFMDLVMPELNGFDAARKILAIDKTSFIVAFTADNMPDARKKSELAGIREFIAKPVRIDDLKKLFIKHFGKS
ncbi:MAG: response regulator [Bacteroidales bacterium]|jgi:signal transduction histidine kinase/DNA-binding response OmpR family regulator